MARDAAHAEDHACKFAEWGYSYYRIGQQGETWTYLLTASGPNWQNVPYGYHAPGALVSGGKGWFGLYHFSDQAELRPATAAARAELRKEWVGYPYTPLGSEHIEHYGSREAVTLGPLTGYAVLYRFIVKEGRGMFDVLASQRGGLLTIQLADGCVSFETTILLRSGDDRDAWASLNSLLMEVTIEKSRGARTAPPLPPGSGYSAVVRPPRKGK